MTHISKLIEYELETTGGTNTHARRLSAMAVRRRQRPMGKISPEMRTYGPTEGAMGLYRVRHYEEPV